MKTFFQITPANGYAMMMPSPKDEACYLAKMNDGIQFWQAARGVPLRSRWNDDWEFVVDPEFDCSKGVGDLAEMNRLIAARRTGFEFLNPLLGRFSEILHGTYGGEELWLFNVINRIPKADIEKVGDHEVFRVDPGGYSILCGRNFKEAFDRSGLTGLKVKEIGPNDTVSFS